MKKWLFICVTFLLAGCWDVNEPERMLYIFGMGVDYKDDEYIIHAQLIDFSNIAKSEQPPSPDAIIAEIGTAKGETPSEALYNLYVTLDEKLFWGHFSYIVFSENALKDGRGRMLINTFVRFHETRYNSWVYSTKEDLKELLLTTPLVNKAISLSKLADPLNSYEQDSTIEPINFRKLIISLDEPSHEVALPHVTLYKKWENNQEEDSSFKIDGVSIISDKEDFKGTLSGEDIQGLQWVNNSTKRSGLTTTSVKNQSKMSIIIQNVSPKILARETYQSMEFDLQISVDVMISGFQGDITNDEVKESVAKQIKEDVRKTFEKSIELDSDVYRLSEHVYRKHHSLWKKYEKDGRIPLSVDSLNAIEVNIVKFSAGRKTFTETID